MVPGPVLCLLTILGVMVSVHVGGNEAAASRDRQRTVVTGGQFNKTSAPHLAPGQLHANTGACKATTARGLCAASGRAWTVKTRDVLMERSLCVDREVLCRAKTQQSLCTGALSTMLASRGCP